jgi:hypothetical protein
MAIGPWVQVLFGAAVGTGIWLVFSSYRALFRRAKTLGLWSDRRDIPETPKYGWIVYPEWTLVLMRDVVTPTSERDGQYLLHRRRLRVGVALCVVSVVCILIVDRFV